ncbi:hypothetical protein AV650_15380 [Serratia fonticola]|nr:hypothetical protein AV650_15380 [Serratia fonticola]
MLHAVQFDSHRVGSFGFSLDKLSLGFALQEGFIRLADTPTSPFIFLISIESLNDFSVITALWEFLFKPSKAIATRQFLHLLFCDLHSLNLQI